MLTVNANIFHYVFRIAWSSRSTAQTRATDKLIGKCQLEYAEKKNKTAKCRIDAYNTTFPSCFTISQVLTLSPMKEKNIYKQHIDRRALNISSVFFSFLIRNSYSTQPELLSFEDICDAEPWFYHVILLVELSAKDRKKNSLANRRILGQNVQNTRTTTRRTDVKPIQ